MLETNQIYCGDSLNLLKQVDDNSIQLHFTSPMYADTKKYDNCDGIHPDKYVDYLIPFIKEMERTLKNDGNIIINISDKVVDRMRHPYVFDLVSEIHKQTNLKMFERLFWNKGKYLPNKSRFGDKIEFLLWFVKSKDFYFDIDSLRVNYDEKSIKRMKSPIKKRFNRNKENQDAKIYKNWAENPLGALPSSLILIGSESRRQSENHCAIFPLKLPSYFISGASRSQDIVCDIFSGSGSTCLAAKQLDRQYLGFDISQLYVDESRIRINNIV
jgi:DNA modification methylase